MRRRELLGTIGLSAAFFLTGCEVQTRKELVLEPEAVLIGRVTVTKGAQVRMNRFILPIAWENLVEVGGQQLDGADGFIVENPSVIFDPDLDQHGNRVPVVLLNGIVRTAVSNLHGGFPFEITSNEIISIVLGHENSRNVRFSEQSRSLPITKTVNGFQVEKNGITISLSEIGKVTVIRGGE